MGSGGSYEPTAVERERPDVELTDPEPVRARRAVRELLAEGPFEEPEIEGMVAAVSEVVTNAHHYGRSPVRLIAWVRGRHAVVTVSDCGDGPDDPDVGLQPAVRKDGIGGLGLWMARQMCQQVVMGRHGDGFTVRLEAGSS